MLLPFVTVIMPIRNEASFIEKSLMSILNQDYPNDRMEIIVADGMSTDGTQEVVKKAIKKNTRYAIHLLENNKRIFSTGFNLGFKRARGEVIVMLGGHTEIAPNYVRRCVDYLNDGHADCVGGPIETVSKELGSQAIALAMSSPFGVGGVAFRSRPHKLREVDTVAFGAYRRSAIENCGLLDEQMVHNQDDEFNYRLRGKGGKILLAPDIRCKYYSRSSIRALWRQYFAYGLWKVRVMQKRPLQMRARHFVPSIFIVAVCASASFALFVGWGKLLFVLIAGSYVLVNFSVSAILAYKKGWQYLPLLILVFTTLHMSYGTGFLVGLIRFANKWRDP